MNIIVSREARKDLLGIRAYIMDELNNPEASARTLRDLKESILSLSDMPKRGKPLDAVLPVSTSFRFLVCGPYKIFYLCDENNVEIVRILHSLQDYMRALF